MKQTAIKFLGLLGATTAATLLGAEQARAIVLVDNFDLDYSSGDLTRDGDTDTTLDPTAGNENILGGERETLYNETPDDTSLGFTRSGRFVGDDEIMTLSVGDAFNSQSGSVQLTYNDFGSAQFITDPNEPDNQGLKFRVFNPNSDADLSVTLFSGSDTSSVNINLDPDNIGGPGDDTDNLFLAFPGFTVDSDATFNNTNFNYDNVTAAEIVLEFPNQVNNSVGIEAFGSTPDRDSTLDPVESTAVPFEAEHSVGFGFLLAWGAWRHWKSRKANKVEAN